MYFFSQVFLIVASLLRNHGVMSQSDIFNLADLNGENVQRPANDLCTNARRIAIGSTTPGSTVDATVPGGIEGTFCGSGGRVTGAAVWYSVTGNGNRLVASTCNAANFDTKLTVYSGGCFANNSTDGAQDCVGGNDDGCGSPIVFTSEFEFDSQAGVQYLILVHGFSFLSGHFNLTLGDTGVASPLPPSTPSPSSKPSAVPSSSPTLSPSSSSPTPPSVAAKTTKGSKSSKTSSKSSSSKSSSKSSSSSSFEDQESMLSTGTKTQRMMRRNLVAPRMTTKATAAAAPKLLRRHLL